MSGGTLSINHKVIESNVDGKMQLFAENKLKTKSSFRTLPLLPPVRELLLSQKKKQEQYCAMFKSSYSTEYLDYVCVDELGKLYWLNYITDHFALLLRQNGLRHIRFHDLRHTFATLALQNGVDIKTVSSMLGHYDAGFTLRTYTHATQQMQEAAADKMGSFMKSIT